jgi:hypothetical protein
MNEGSIIFIVSKLFFNNERSKYNVIKFYNNLILYFVINYFKILSLYIISIIY